MAGRGLIRASRREEQLETAEHHESVHEQFNAAVKRYYALRETLMFEQGQLAAINKSLLDLHNLKWDDATPRT